MTSQTEEVNSIEHSTNFETVDEVTRKVSVTIPAEKLELELGNALAKAQKTAHLKGFRPGKAPKQLVEKTYGAKLQYDVVDRLIGQSLQQIIKNMPETVIGRPNIDLDNFEVGKPLTYTVSLEVWPEPAVVGYKSLELTVAKREVAQEQIDETVKKFLESKADLKPIDGRTVVNLGDVVDAELIELKNGQPGADREPFVVPLGEKMLPEEIEQALIGMNVAQEKDIFLALGKHKNQDATGENKPNYRIHVKGIKTRDLPELSDDFIKNAGIPGIETILEFKTDISKRLEEELEQQRQSDLDLAIIDQLVKVNTFKVPSTLIDDEIKNLVASIANTKEQRIDPAKLNPEPFRSAFSEQAEKRVRTTIIIDRIAAIENLKADDNDFEKHCAELANKYNMTADQIKEILSHEDQHVAVLMQLTRDKVFVWLKEQAKVTYSEQVQVTASAE